jgi:hypothetical protein
MNPQQQIVLPRLKRKAWRTRSTSADGGRRLGVMVSSLCCWLNLIPDVCSDYLLCLSTSISRTWLRTVLVKFPGLFCQLRPGKNQLQLELLGPTVHLPGELRAQPWNRQSVWNMGLMI